jgi:hypothetical protein
LSLIFVKRLPISNWSVHSIGKQPKLSRLFDAIF